MTTGCFGSGNELRRLTRDSEGIGEASALQPSQQRLVLAARYSDFLRSTSEDEHDRETFYKLSIHAKLLFSDINILPNSLFGEENKNIPYYHQSCLII